MSDPQRTEAPARTLREQLATMTLRERLLLVARAKECRTDDGSCEVDRPDDPWSWCTGCIARELALLSVSAPLEPGWQEFSAANRARCESPQGFNHRLSSWDTSDWFLAVLGELGEAANVAKKLNRIRDGIPGNKESEDELRNKLRKEIGDAEVYLDLLSQAHGFSLLSAAIEVFNSKSEEIGYPMKLPAPPSSTSQGQLEG